ncbi:MAG: helix-turn-helix transcriptional regulator, partial [Clostridia bacterium]|nr:helix-turn-helix transcriptional regulator [Clostridia bacterium]
GAAAGGAGDGGVDDGGVSHLCRRAGGRAAAGQDGLSERAGVSKQYLSLLEKGKKKGRLEIYYHIALALNITMDTLIGNQAPLDSAISHSDIVEKISNYSQKQYEQLIDYMGYIDYAADKEGK